MNSKFFCCSLILVAIVMLIIRLLMGDVSGGYFKNELLITSLGIMFGIFLSFLIASLLTIKAGDKDE